MKKVKVVKIRVDLKNPQTFPKGFVDKDKLDVITEAQIRLHATEDEEQARLEATNKNA